MGRAAIEIRGSDLFCSIEGIGKEARFSLDEARAKLSDWSERYGNASKFDDEDTILSVGREMFSWLDRSDWVSSWFALPQDRILDIHVTGRAAATEALLMDAPWEILATDQGPLALDPLQLFIVTRRLDPGGSCWAPRHGDIQLIFMAAAPEGQSPLDFESEEAAILAATRGGRTHLIVEETGALSALEERLTSEEGPFEVVHISCHGTIDPKRGPVLMLETIEGGAALATPGELVERLGGDPPPLVVISACRSAEHDGPAANNHTGFTAPFARQLASVTANIIGWDGSVYDEDAIKFAAEFYVELGQRRSAVPRAAAYARRALLRLRSSKSGQGLHWHLARCYLGPGGGGALCAAGLRKRRPHAGSTPRAFLDASRRRIPVASRDTFVGRRRTLQAVLRTFREDASEVLLFGMGAVGKSSAAARIANRLSRPTCVVFESYDALSIFDALADMLPPEHRRQERERWRMNVQNDEAALAEPLESWLENYFDVQPILLIIDDLERILEPPQAGDSVTNVLPQYRKALGAVLTAFDRAKTSTRLLITSRYDFTLLDDRGQDLTSHVRRHPVIAMPFREREKQLRAEERISGRKTSPDSRRDALLARALAEAGGNPGLQAALTKPILAGEYEAAEMALSQIATLRTTGVPPSEIQALLDSGQAHDSENALVAFLARVSLQTYRDALTDDESAQLAACSLFSEDVPIPLPALRAAGEEAGCTRPANALERLLSLGLLDDWGISDGCHYAAINTLARPLVQLDDAERPGLAAAALGPLTEAWRNLNRQFPIDTRGVEAAELALVAGADPELIEETVTAGALWLERAQGRTHEAVALVRRANAQLPPDYPADATFLRVGVEAATSVGEAALADALLARKVRDCAEDDRPGRSQIAQLELRRAERFVSLGRLTDAEALSRSALKAFRTLEDDRMSAMALGKIAEILFRRGKLDEALRIRREEELPVYERIGDDRERAVTMGEIAEILVQRGERAEALRIHREDELPVYKRLGDARGVAAAMAQIADLLLAEGDTVEALRIRREEVHPVMDALGDVRERAVNLGRIADILHDEGKVEEALHIRRTEELPVYERIGDVRSKAVTMGRIADALELLGDPKEALRLRREEELPVYESLEDIRSQSVTLTEIAVTLVKHPHLAANPGQEIVEALSRSFNISLEAGFPDGIDGTGWILCQVLAYGGQPVGARHVRDAAVTALEGLGKIEMAKEFVARAHDLIGP
jgi:tetratricopeptide (TPR) repeat protein